ncbi:MAG: AMP-binding protein, partial [Rhodospirillaceae bacterium]|nr:AMP-binding protein [Rhodospirillaceae bacterium]
ALDAPSGRIDYAQLWGRLQRCGALLAERGAGPEGIVAVALARSADLIVAELGCWHAGAAFLPLDPRQPPERLRALCERAGARLLIAGPILGALAARGRMAGIEGAQALQHPVV